MTSASPYSDTAAPDSRAEPGPAQADGLQQQAAVNHLPERQPPLASSCWLHGSQPGKGQPNIIANQTALRQIQEHSISSLESELGGVLLGRAFRHEERLYVEVEAALPAESGDRGPVHFKFTADAWAQLHRDRAAHYPDLDIVGWFHTHPDLGVFYSGDDVVVHSAAFVQPWHAGLVLDPVRNEASFFGWLNGELSPFAGFYERHDDQAESAVSWTMVDSAVWQESYDAAHPFPGGSRVLAPANRWLSLSPLTASLGMLAGGLALVLGFFLLVGWVMPLNRQIDRLETVVMLMADQTMGEKFADACANPGLRILNPLAGSQLQPGGKIPIVGTADYPGAFRYRVEVRGANDGVWTLLGQRRRGTALGQLAVWDAREIAPAAYEMRLTAVDRNNVLLSDSASCTIQLQLAN